METTMTIRISKELKSELEKAADKQDRPLSWYVRKVLENHKRK